MSKYETLTKNAKKSGVAVEQFKTEKMSSEELIGLPDYIVPQKGDIWMESNPNNTPCKFEVIEVIESGKWIVYKSAHTNIKPVLNTVENFCNGLVLISRDGKDVNPDGTKKHIEPIYEVFPIKINMQTGELLVDTGSDEFNPTLQDAMSCPVIAGKFAGVQFKNQSEKHGWSMNINMFIGKCNMFANNLNDPPDIFPEQSLWFHSADTVPAIPEKARFLENWRDFI